jgi:HAD superfamily hydrolase (TIGR01509 family)
MIEVSDLIEGGVLRIGPEGERDMKAVLFDFDGTLVDSDAAQILSFNHVLTPHGRPMSEADYAWITGWSNDAIFESLFPDSSHEFRSDLSEQKEEALLGNQELVVLQPGAKATLSALSDRGLTLALVTNAPRVLVEPVLERLAIRPYFATCICNEDFEMGKPHPAPYQLALARLGFGAQQAIAIEDSEVGRRSAEAAGLRVALYDNKTASNEGARPFKRIQRLLEVLDIVP